MDGCGFEFHPRRTFAAVLRDSKIDINIISLAQARLSDYQLHLVPKHSSAWALNDGARNPVSQTSGNSDYMIRMQMS